MHHACQNDDDSSVSVSPTHNVMCTTKGYNSKMRAFVELNLKIAELSNHKSDKFFKK